MEPPRVVQHALAQLAWPVEIVAATRCKNCGQEVRANIQFVATGKTAPRPRRMDSQPAAERRNCFILKTDGMPSTFLGYPGVSIPGQDVVYPAHEGNLSAAKVIDRYGDPDLMAEFASEYLKQYGVIVPKGRLPNTVSEMMPGLNLLVNAGELAIKASLIRSGNESGGTRFRCSIGAWTASTGRRSSDVSRKRRRMRT